MNRSFKTIIGCVVAALLLIGMSAYAQSESKQESRSVSVSTIDGGKVKLKVVTKKGSHTETFEKTYDSQEDMQNDPELKEKGITFDDWGFGSSSFSFGSSSGGSSMFRKSPNFSFFFGDDEDSPFSSSFMIDIDSMLSNLKGLGSMGSNSFHFGPGHGFDMDSLMQKFDFTEEDGKYFFNGEEFKDLESLKKELKEQFDDLDFDFDFDFDFGDNHNGSWVFSHGNKDDDVRVISRARVFVRTAREADKEAVGADKMDDLTIKDISFYPNPSDGRFNVEIDTGNGQSVQVKIINPTGEVVYDKNDQRSDGIYNFKVDISGSEEGIYILQVIQNNSALTKRIIIE